MLDVETQLNDGVRMRRWQPPPRQKVCNY
jgi:hypothetical protein